MTGAPIDVGTPGQWLPEGLARLDNRIHELAEYHAETKSGAQTLRWHFLEAVLTDPVPRPIQTIASALEPADMKLWAKVRSMDGVKRGRLDDEEIGVRLQYETDYPVRARLWRQVRERVFERVCLMFGSKPSTPTSEELDIGKTSAWNYDVIRVLDDELRELVYHHAHNETGAETLRWHIWNELSFAPRPVTLAAIEKQLEDAESSLIARFGDEFRRARGHLRDDMIARMLGFRTPRPVVEGYYRILREKVYGRLADGFGAVDLPEYSRNPQAYDIGRQGEWKPENLRRVDAELTELVRSYAKTDAGARTMRWFLLDELTADPEPVDLTVVAQRLSNMSASVLSLFAAVTGKRQQFLADAKIARVVGARDERAIASGYWRTLRERVLERVDDNVFELEPESD